MHASASPLGKILDGDRRFIIPPYQRAYAWAEEEALTLLSDLRFAQEHAPHRRGDAAPYFMGSIVLVRAAGDPVEHVVDGHQRLTTISILLAVLRDLDAEEGIALDRHIRRRGAGAGGEAQGVLAIRPLDTDFFKRSIQQPGATRTLTEDTTTENDAQASILGVALAFRAALEPMDAAARRWLADYVLKHCFVVEVVAPYQDQAFQIYTVMNDRGRLLTDADLMKAELMRALPPDQRSYYAQIWERMEAELGQAAFTQLFGHLRMIHTPRKAKTAVAYEIRETLNPAANPRDFIERELEPKGRALKSLLKANLNLGQKSVEANRLLRALHRIRNKDWLPPAIAYFAARRPDGAEALAFLKALDRMAYVLFIQGVDENKRIARFGPVIELIRDGAAIGRILEKMDLSANEKRQARAVLGGSIFNKERVRLAVLLRVDEHLSENSATYDPKVVSVEHVLPQNPPPHSPWAQSWSPGDRKFWTDKLGNLALLSREKNNDARNYDFQHKIREYFTKGGVTPFVITSQLLMEKEWTPDAAQRRHEKLLQAAYEIWDL